MYAYVLFLSHSGDGDAEAHSDLPEDSLFMRGPASLCFYMGSMQSLCFRPFAWTDWGPTSPHHLPFLAPTGGHLLRGTERLRGCMRGWCVVADWQAEESALAALNLHDNKYCSI